MSKSFVKTIIWILVLNREMSFKERSSNLMTKLRFKLLSKVWVNPLKGNLISKEGDRLVNYLFFSS
jgi:hypothetical protein